MNLNSKTTKGFTIIELVISIFILSVAVVGIFSAFSIMVVLTTNASDRLTAAYLGQEGIEIIRNIRDTNWLNMNAGVSGATWLRNLDYCEASEGCEADYTTGTNASAPWSITPWAGGHYLYIDANGFYGYTPPPSPAVYTKFRRQIQLTQITDVDGNTTTKHIVKVKVTVFWTEKPNLLNPTGTAGSIIVEEYFYDWYNFNG
jgi:prepilin-type N-terminal cleavage/methylation domain-containing protein